MAFELNLKIHGGPDRWGALLGSLYEGKTVRFHVPGKFIGFYRRDAPQEWIYARITSMARGGPQEYDKGVTDDWILKGELASSEIGTPTGLVFTGPFNTHTRFGGFTITERTYRSGDVFFGWKDAAQTKRIRPSEVIRIES